MDQFTRSHLAAWIESNETEQHRPDTYARMVRFVSDHPELLDTRTWPEIHSLALRSL